MMRLLAGLMAAATALPALADEPAGALPSAIERLTRAEAALATARGGPDPVAGYGAAIPDFQAALTALRRVVVDAEQRERAISSALATRRDELMRLAAGLQALSRAAQGPQRLHPGGPLAAARASAMLDGLTPQVRDEASELSAALRDLHELRDLHAAGAEALAGGIDALAAAREDLSLTMAAVDRAPGPDDLAGAALLRSSDTLSALAAGLAQAGAEPAEEGDAAEPTRLTWPVEGMVALHFNEPDAAGVHRPGITVAAPPLALVSAPVDATVRYAGPFLDYGYVVVVQPEPATLVTLAGMAQLNVSAGGTVRRGDLLGLLGGRARNAEEYVMPQTGTGADSAETLYIEIRHGQGPVDPEPWFSGGNG